MNQRPTAEQREHWNLITRLGCIALLDDIGMVCGSHAEIAHAHGGSIVDRMGEPKAKGVKLRRYHWLALPLCPIHGRPEYQTGLDYNVEAWERRHGPQALYIDRLCALFGIDLWARAKEGRK